MLLHLDRKVIAPRSEGIWYSTSNYLIFFVSTTTVPMCEPASPRCLTGNTVSSKSEIQQLASYVARLVTSLSTGPIRVLPSRTETFSSSFSRLIGWHHHEGCRSIIKQLTEGKIEGLSLLSWYLSREWSAYAEWYTECLLVFSEILKLLLELFIFDTLLSQFRTGCAECCMSLRGSLSWWDHLRCTHPHTEFELYQWVTYSELVHQVAQLCGIICTGFIAIPWWQGSYYWISQIMDIDISVLITSHTYMSSLCDQLK